MRIIATLLLTILLPLAARAQSPAITETCSPSIHNDSGLVQGALATMLSFDYIHHALEQVASPGAVYCVLGIPLSRNPYQYFQYYVRIDIRPSADAPVAYRFRFLYQDASTQAYQNTQATPWIGLPVEQTSAIFARLVPQDYTNVKGSGLAPIPSFKAFKPELDPQTLAAFSLANETLNPADVNLTFTTALTAPGQNPYASVVRPWGAILQGTVDAYTGYEDYLAVSSDLLFPLEDLVSRTATTLPAARDAWAAKLIDLATVK